MPLTCSGRPLKSNGSLRPHVAASFVASPSTTPSGAIVSWPVVNSPSVNHHTRVCGSTSSAAVEVAAKKSVPGFVGSAEARV